MPKDVRPDIVAWAKWAVANRSHFHYAEIRPMPLTVKFPIVTDCSGFATWVYRQAGAHDPNKLQYNGRGYTGTLLAAGKKTTMAKAKPGDLIVYGPGTGWHVAIIIEPGPNALTISMGREGDPSYVHVNEDGRHPQTVLTYDTALAWPPTPLPGK